MHLEEDPPVLDEEIFSSGKIYCSGQAIGLLVADTLEHARAAAKAVKVDYANAQPPILTIEDALAGRKKKGSKTAFAATAMTPQKGRVRQSESGEGQ